MLEQPVSSSFDASGVRSSARKAAESAIPRLVPPNCKIAFTLMVREAAAISCTHAMSEFNQTLL
jgi:hypothetical protein